MNNIRFLSDTFCIYLIVFWIIDEMIYINWVILNKLSPSTCNNQKCLPEGQEMIHLVQRLATWVRSLRVTWGKEEAETWELFSDLQRYEPSTYTTLHVNQSINN